MKKMLLKREAKTITKDDFKEAMVNAMDSDNLQKVFKDEPSLMLLYTIICFELEKELFKEV